MIYTKYVNLVLSLLIAVVAVTLLGFSPARQNWMINAWSVQYARYAFSPTMKKVVLADPPLGHARSALWLASSALQSGNPTLAETLIASQAAQGDQYAMRLMADALLAQGDITRGVAIWKQLGDFSSLQRAGLQAQQAGLLDEALMAYEAAMTVDPESGTLPLANFLLDSRQDFVRAENVLQQSLATFPNSSYRPVWSRRLGDALRAQNRWDEAAAAYERTIAQTPGDWAAHLGLGWTRYERGDGLQAAMSEFQKVIKLPESQGNGQFAIAQVLTREKQFEEADTWFAQALALNPDYRWWYIIRGNAAWQAGNLARALDLYQETVARFPDYAYAYFQMAYAYQMNEQPAQAITAIERALALMAPPNAEYYALAGSIFEGAGNESQALKDYHEALLIDPQNAAALAGVERLDK